MIMVKTGSTSIFGEEIHHSKSYRTLGLLNGILIGLALALGAWGVSAYTQASLPTRLPFTGFILAGILLLTISGTAGWLTSRFAKGWFTVLIWFLVAVLAVLIIGFEANYIRTLLIWLTDRRFWGLPVYSPPTGSSLPILIAGFFVFIVIGVLAFLQDYRLEGGHGRLGPNNRISFGALVYLCLPLPIVILAAFINNNIVGGANAPFAIDLVHEVIQTGRTYEGDLFQLSRERGINYNAIKGMQDMMSGNYTLGITGFDAASSAVIVTADFDNGAWVDCRVVNEQVGFCFDGSPPYTIGFASLITGDPLPEVCAGCVIRVDETWRSWLRARNDNFDSNPQMEKVVQWGTYTLMRAESPGGDYAVECWFRRSGVIELDSCSEQ
jgi:hypothetical protein